MLHGIPYALTWESVRQCILNVFATRYSYSVQDTLYYTANEILGKFGHIDEISITMPNIHNLPTPVPFQVKGEDTVFYQSGEPHGVISATCRRQKAKL